MQIIHTSLNYKKKSGKESNQGGEVLHQKKEKEKASIKQLEHIPSWPVFFQTVVMT